MRRRIMIISFGLLIVAAGAALFFAPHYVVYRVKESVEARDAETLSRYVDYPALRESLKAGCTALIGQKAAESQKGNPLEAFGFALAQALVTPMIDSLVTPDGLAMLLQGRKPELGRSGKKHRESDSASEKAEARATRLSMGYDGPNRFNATVRKKGAASDPVTLVFKRYGILSWKLCAVELTS